MRVRLQCNGLDCLVTPFVGRFIANVCCAMMESLKAPQPSKTVMVALDGDIISVEIDGIAVPLDERQGFAQTIVRDTVRGMISHLKGIDSGRTIRIEVLPPFTMGKTTTE